MHWTWDWTSGNLFADHCTPVRNSKTGFVPPVAVLDGVDGLEAEVGHLHGPRHSALVPRVPEL